MCSNQTGTSHQSLYGRNVFLEDPSVFWDHRQQKRSPKSPDFRSKQTRKPLWIEGWDNPPQFKLKLTELKENASIDLKFQDRSSLFKLINSLGKDKKLWKVREIHGDLLSKNLISKDVYIATALIKTYAKCGALREAQEVFDHLLKWDVISFTALIGGYTQHGLGKEALQCFKNMQDEGVLPNLETYICVLKASGLERSLEVGECIDVEVRKLGLLPEHIVLSTAVLAMYAKCGAFEKAKGVFEQLPIRNVVSWTALIDGYVQHGRGDDAISCFRQMQDEGVCPNVVTYMCILKACGIIGSLDVGEAIDAEVRKQGLLQKDVMLNTALVDMYAKCGALEKAREVFEQFPVRNVVSWTALISGYVEHGFNVEALRCSKKMRDEGIFPNSITYIYMLRACGITGCIDIGEDIEFEVQRQGLLQKDTVLCTALIGMYIKCGALEKARKIFNQLQIKHVSSWTTLIAGYAEHGLGDEALKCFSQMQDEGVLPNTSTYICVLKACGIVQSLEIGEDIDAEIRKQGLLQKDIMIANALLGMYVKCGMLDKALEVFKRILVPDVVSWTTLIAGYTEHGLANEGLKCFKKMQDGGIRPNSVTYICVMKACGMVGSLEIGEDMDVEIRKQGLLQKDIVLGNALLDMYGKCGALEKAQEVFEQLPERDIVSWNALITGYSHLGEINIVLDLYREMNIEGIVPNPVSFLVLLTACSHAGLLREGEKLFCEMRDVYRLTPSQEHYTCMLDLFGRAGHFDKAKALLQMVSTSDHLPLFLAVLGACRKWVNVELGLWAFEQSIQLDKTCAAAYVCMKNIYAEVDMQTEVDSVEALRVKNKA